MTEPLVAPVPNRLEPLRLTAFEFRGRLEEGSRTRPPLVVAGDASGNEYKVVLKLRKWDGYEGHYGETSLTCELTCAALARAFGLPVPDYAVVDLPPQLHNAVRDHTHRALLQNNIGPVFGSVLIEGAQIWSRDISRGNAAIIPSLEGVLAFDTFVYNRDRRFNKPNLLWNGRHVSMIDHSLALPVSRDDGLPLLNVENVREHCTFTSLRGRKCKFNIRHWRDLLSPEALQRIRAFIPPTWERARGDISKIFTAVGEQLSRLDEISTWLRRFVQ